MYTSYTSTVKGGFTDVIPPWFYTTAEKIVLQNIIWTQNDDKISMMINL